MTVNSPARLTPGTVVSDAYRIERLLGHGSMGSVFRVQRLSDGLACALKALDASAFNDPRAIHRFQREARLGATIHSPNVIRTLATGVDEAQGIHWIAMELVEGVPLDRWLERERPTDEQRRSVLEQLFRAMAVAHAAGVVHRDLKPDNVLITQTPEAAPQVKRLDFGISKIVTGNTGLSTVEGLGTPLWTAPEQNTAGHRPCPSADVWSLGLLTFLVLTDRIYWKHAHPGSSLVDLALELLRSAIEKPSVRATELGVETPLPRGFDAWFARCVARNHAARFPHAGAAFDALAPIVGMNPRNGVRHRWRTLVVVIVVVALVVALGWVLVFLNR